MTLEEKLEEKYGFVMTRKQAMKELLISLSTIKRMEANGTLIPMKNVGKTVKFRTETIAKFIEGESDDS